MPFSITFQKFVPVAPNLHNIVFDDVMKLINKCEQNLLNVLLIITNANLNNKQNFPTSQNLILPRTTVKIHRQ